MVPASVLELFVVVTSAPAEPSSLIAAVFVTLVVTDTCGTLTAKSIVPVAPIARLAETELVQAVPAAAPLAQLQVPVELAELNVVPTGTVVLTTTGPDATLALFSLA